MEFFVSSEGNNLWSGKLPEPNGNRTDGPFATLHRARDAVRDMRGTHGELKEPVTVMVRGGKYFMEETLVLGKKDSGTHEFPISYIAYPDETPILSGGRKVTDWQLFRDEILHSELAGSKGGKWKSRQLFCNGKRMPRARWPKADPNDPIYTGWAFTEGPDEENPTQAFRYKPGTFRRSWAKPTEVEVKIFAVAGWFMKFVPIKQIDEETRTIVLAYNQWNCDISPWYIPIRFKPDNRFYIENALEELDQPGEWCFDSEDGVIYFWPREGPVEGCEVVVPELDCLIDINGSSWITVSGLSFTETLDGENLHPEGTEGCGAMAIRMGARYVGNALRLRCAEHCRIVDNHFRDVGGNAIYLEDHNARNEVRYNEISGAGANGICLAGSSLRHPVFNEVADNYIHHCGEFNKYIAGVFLGMSDGNSVRHNRIEHMPHHAINLSENSEGRNYVEYNEIRWATQEISDTAAINCWMELPGREAQRCGHVIRYNYISDTYGTEVIDGKVTHSQEFPTSGLYLDNCASNCLVYGNIFVRCGVAGVLIHNGKNNVIENNIFVDCQSGVRLQDFIVMLPYWKDMEGFMTGNVIQRNICFQTRPDAYLYNLHGHSAQGWSERSVARADGNLFYHTSSSDYRLDFQGSVSEDTDCGQPSEKQAETPQRIDTLEKWRALGFDLNSRFEDPLFVDPDGDDYRLQSDSPALELGFQPIDISKIGIREKQ